MKAIIRDQYGTPDKLVLKEIERPEPKTKEVLIKVLAASVNKADWYLLQGKPLTMRMMSGMIKPHDKILGADIAGVVEGIGSGVTQFKIGDEVFGDLSGNGFGGFAEYVTANEKYLAKKPTNLSFEEAAVLPMAAVTALQGLRDKGKIKAMEEVLINGASGGVGSFAIQIAKAYGAKVTAVCSTNKVEHAKIQGADTVIDYRKHNFTQENKQYDLIFDIVANHSGRTIRQILKAKGTYVTCAFSMGAFLSGSWIQMTQGKRMVNLMASPNHADLQYICKLAEEEKLKPWIEKYYTLDDVPEALHTIGKGRSAGKLVITL